MNKMFMTTSHYTSSWFELINQIWKKSDKKSDFFIWLLQSCFVTTQKLWSYIRYCTEGFGLTLCCRTGLICRIGHLFTIQSFVKLHKKSIIGGTGLLWFFSHFFCFTHRKVTERDQKLIAQPEISECTGEKYQFRQLITNRMSRVVPMNAHN